MHNDSLKPRQAITTYLQQVQKPTRPEQSRENSMIVSPTEKII